METFPNEIQEILARPIDSKALSAGPKGLTSIKSIYISERLNQAFGLGRWQIEAMPIVVTEARTEARTDKKTGKEYEVTLMPMVVVRVALTLLDYPWFHAWSYGGNDNPDLGDAYKGAVSDALSKICAVHLGVAQDVFKGLQDSSTKPEPKRKPKEEAKPEIVGKAAVSSIDDRLIKGEERIALFQECHDFGASMEQIKAAVLKVTGAENSKLIRLSHIQRVKEEAYKLANPQSIAGEVIP